MPNHANRKNPPIYSPGSLPFLTPRLMPSRVRPFWDHPKHRRGDAAQGILPMISSIAANEPSNIGDFARIPMIPPFSENFWAKSQPFMVPSHGKNAPRIVPTTAALSCYAPLPPAMLIVLQNARAACHPGSFGQLLSKKHARFSRRCASEGIIIPCQLLWWTQNVPTGKLTVCYWEWPFSSLIYLLNIVIFHRHVSSPDGIWKHQPG